MERHRRIWNIIGEEKTEQGPLRELRKTDSVVGRGTPQLCHRSQDLEKEACVQCLKPTLRRQKQVDLCKFKVSLVYRGSSRTARAIQRSPVSKINQ